jgi:hypothetical protein
MFNAPRSDLQIQVQQQLGRLLRNLIFAWKIDVPDCYHLELAHKMDRPALPDLGQTRQSRRVEEEVGSAIDSSALSMSPHDGEIDRRHHNAVRIPGTALMSEFFRCERGQGRLPALFAALPPEPPARTTESTRTRDSHSSRRCNIP